MFLFAQKYKQSKHCFFSWLYLFPSIVPSSYYVSLGRIQCLKMRIVVEGKLTHFLSYLFVIKSPSSVGGRENNILWLFSLLPLPPLTIAISPAHMPSENKKRKRKKRSRGRKRRMDERGTLFSPNSTVRPVYKSKSLTFQCRFATTRLIWVRRCSIKWEIVIASQKICTV